jgi:hypothetical protein
VGGHKQFTIIKSQAIFAQKQEVNEHLGSRLRGWNLRQKDTKVCFYRNRQEEFQDFYSEENDLVYCNNFTEYTNTMFCIWPDDGSKKPKHVAEFLISITNIYRCVID